jgi:transcriptional regulator ATRX
VVCPPPRVVLTEEAKEQRGKGIIKLSKKKMVSKKSKPKVTNLVNIFEEGKGDKDKKPAQQAVKKVEEVKPEDSDGGEKKRLKGIAMSDDEEEEEVVVAEVKGEGDEAEAADGNKEYTGEDDGPSSPAKKRRKRIRRSEEMNDDEDKAEQGHVEQEAREKAEAARRAKDGMEMILSTEGGEVKVPLEILQHLQDHQVDGVRFMYDNTIGSCAKAAANENQRGCVLAHCMGLGKTLQVVALTATVLANPQLGIKRVLCIVPVNVLRNWDAEYLKWTPLVPVFTVGGETGNVNKKRVTTLEQWESAENGAVLLIGYDTFRNLIKGSKIKKAEWKETFHRCLLKVPQFVVCDEGHMMKNSDSGMSQAVSQLECARRVVLTGTPLQNNLMEYWTMVNFVRPGLLGTAKEFKEKFEGPITNGQHADSERSEVMLMKKRSHILSGLLNQMIHRASPVPPPEARVYHLGPSLRAPDRALQALHRHERSLQEQQGPLQGVFESGAALYPPRDPRAQGAACWGPREAWLRLD